MEMTINRAIDRINTCLTDVREDKNLDATAQALVIAMDTMRKYQKIQEIVKNTQQLCSYGSAFIDIREVIEDGKDIL